MKFSYVFLLLAVNFVTTVVAYYKKCYKEFSVCLITNTDDPFFQSSFRLNQRLADDWCKRNSSSLAIITNANVQSAIEAFINDSSAKLDSDVIITNGYRIKLNNWEWINGKRSAYYPSSQSSDYHYGYLQVSWGGRVILNASTPAAKRNFICTYLSQGSMCKNNHLQLGNICYKICNNYAENWFDARNLCFQEFSDLAICQDCNINSISVLLNNGEYWIGLRIEEWKWQFNQTHMEIMYSNWDDNKPSATDGDCLCLTANTGKWKDCSCSQNHRYICIQDYASNSNTSSEPRLSSTGDASHLQSTPSQIMYNYSPDNIENTGTNHSPGYIDSQHLIIWMSLAILINLIIIVAVVATWIIIKKSRKRNILVGESSKNKTNQSPLSVDAYSTLKPETSTDNRTYDQLQIYETIGDDETE